jgi:hypothetical protein
MEFHSEPFLRREKLLEFHSEPFPGREKLSEFRSEPFLDEKKLRNSIPNNFRQEKKIGKKTTFVSCFVKLQYFAEFRFVPCYGMDSSEVLGITWNEHFIPRNKIVSRLFCGIFSE